MQMGNAERAKTECSNLIHLEHRANSAFSFHQRRRELVAQRFSVVLHAFASFDEERPAQRYIFSCGNPTCAQHPGRVNCITRSFNRFWLIIKRGNHRHDHRARLLRPAAYFPGESDIERSCRECIATSLRFSFSHHVIGRPCDQIVARAPLATAASVPMEARNHQHGIDFVACRKRMGSAHVLNSVGFRFCSWGAPKNSAR